MSQLPVERALVRDKIYRDRAALTFLILDFLTSISFQLKELLKENNGRRIRVVFDLLSQLLMLNSTDTVYKFLSQLLAEIKRYDAVVLAPIEEAMHQAQVSATMELLFDGVLVLKSVNDMERKSMEIDVRKMMGVSLGSKTKTVFVLSTWEQVDKQNVDRDHPTRTGRLKIAILPFINNSLEL